MTGIFVAKEINFVSPEGEILIENIAEEWIDSEGNYAFAIYRKVNPVAQKILKIAKYAEILQGKFILPTIGSIKDVYILDLMTKLKNENEVCVMGDHYRKSREVEE